MRENEKNECSDIESLRNCRKEKDVLGEQSKKMENATVSGASDGKDTQISLAPGHSSHAASGVSPNSLASSTSRRSSNVFCKTSTDESWSALQIWLQVCEEMKS